MELLNTSRYPDMYGLDLANRQRLITDVAIKRQRVSYFAPNTLERRRGRGQSVNEPLEGHARSTPQEKRHC